MNKRIELKNHNFFPDFKNESLQKIHNELIQNIKKKKMQGFENFGFHDLSLNFNFANTDLLQTFTNNLLQNETEKILVICNKSTIDNFNSGHSFLNSNDLLKEHKAQLFFINIDDDLKIYFNNWNFYKSIIEEKTTRILISETKSFNEASINIIKMILNVIQLKFGFYNALKNVYLVAKEKVEKQLEFLNIPYQNRLIMPSILTKNFDFFSEINMLLLALKGANTIKIIEGYSYASFDFLSQTLENNVAFQYAYFLDNASKNKTYHFCLNNNKNLISLLNSHLRYFNSLLINEMNFTILANMSRDLYSYGQSLINNANNIYVSYYSLNNEKTDYFISDEIYFKDGLNSFKNNKISQIINSINYGIIETLSNSYNTLMCQINILDNSDTSLGYLIAFNYWSTIFLAYLQNKNPFLKEL